MAFNVEVKRLSKRYRSLKDDIRELSEELRQNPEMGVSLGNGLRKVRMAIAAKGKGKRGGARVITLLLRLSDEEGEIGLHYIYDKSERESISDRELEEILRKNGVV